MEEQIARMYRFIDRWEQRALQSTEKTRRTRWPSKEREPLVDCLPTTLQEWNELPAAIEQAYRRGFAQGALQAYYAVRDGAPLSRVEKWAVERVQRWRHQDTMRPGCPPERPA